MPDSGAGWVPLGRIGAPHGILGWFALHTFSSTPLGIFGYESLFLQDRAGVWKPCVFRGHRVTAKGVQAALEGVDSPEAVALVRGALVGVPRASLPDLDPGEFYWRDLEGLPVVDPSGNARGQLVYLYTAGAQDICVIQQGRAEWHVPFLWPEVVTSVCMPDGPVVIEWDWDACG